MNHDDSVSRDLPAPAPARVDAQSVGPASAPALASRLLSRIGLLLALLLGAAGLLLSVLQWQKLGNLQEELVRRSADATAQSIEARTLARQAEAGTRELTARLALLETRLSEVSVQRSQLEELMQSLSRSRDETLVVDLDAALRLAQQQAQFTGNAELLLAALKSADQRLSRAAQPRLNPVQRAIARDMARIKATTVTDVPGLLSKLNELARQVDDLPLANAMVPGAVARQLAAPVAPARAAAGQAAPAGPWARLMEGLALNDWWKRLLRGSFDEVRGLLRVSRIDQPDAALLAPEQAFFLRENLKLKLLNARVGLLSRQTASARSDMAAVVTLLGKYFDPESRRTQNAVQTAQQVQSQLISSDLPRLDDTVSALATAAAGR